MIMDSVKRSTKETMNRFDQGGLERTG